MASILLLTDTRVVQVDLEEIADLDSSHHEWLLLRLHPTTDPHDIDEAASFFLL